MKQETPRKNDVISDLELQSFRFPPVNLEMLNQSSPVLDLNCDCTVQATWDSDATAKFAVEFKRLGTPRVFEDAIRRLESWRLPPGTFPLLMLPYLKPEQLEELDRRSLSGVDLCGNGVMTVPGRLKVYRTGQPNRFRSSAAIKNVYRGNTSQVARLFAVKSSFPNVNSVRCEIIGRNPLVESKTEKPISLSTISKALKSLEEDLVIARDDSGTIRTLQRDQLLDKLLRNDEPLQAISRTRLKVDATSDKLVEFIAQRTRNMNSPLAATGLSSTTRYAVMQREPVIELYTTSVSDVTQALEASEVTRFENVVLIESKRSIDYFDRRIDEGFPWASPLQTYLELMRGDKRDKETAQQIREDLLKMEVES